MLMPVRNVHFHLQKDFPYERLSHNMISFLGYCDVAMQEKGQVRIYTICCDNHIVYDFL